MYSVTQTIMQNRHQSARINICIDPEDKEFLQQYCEKKNKSITMVLRDHIKQLRYSVTPNDDVDK